MASLSKYSETRWQYEGGSTPTSTPAAANNLNNSVIFSSYINDCSTSFWRRIPVNKVKQKLVRQCAPNGFNRSNITKRWKVHSFFPNLPTIWFIYFCEIYARFNFSSSVQELEGSSKSWSSSKLFLIASLYWKKKKEYKWKKEKKKKCPSMII